MSNFLSNGFHVSFRLQECRVDEASGWKVENLLVFPQFYSLRKKQKQICLGRDRIEDYWLVSAPKLPQS